MTDGPDDILRGLIEGAGDGPEATPEQEAFVSGLLSSLRRDDPPMPDDVVRRLDAVLAEERRSGGSSPVLTALPGGGSADLEPGAPGLLPDGVSVLPTAAERRGPTMRSYRLIGGLAAAALVVVGGVAVLNGGGPAGSSSDSSGAGSPVAASVVQDSGTAYSASALDTQAETLVRKVSGRSVTGSGAEAPESTPAFSSPADAPATPTPTSTPTPAAAGGSPLALPSPASGEPVTAERASLCAAELSGGAVTEPLLVDQGTYDGKDAEVYVLPSTDAPGAYDVFVVAAGCTTGVADLYAFQRVAPVSDGP